jgi:hypothetical protein
MRRDPPVSGVQPLVGLAVSMALHALLFTVAFTHFGTLPDKPDPSTREQRVTVLYLRPPECWRRLKFDPLTGIVPTEI